VARGRMRWAGGAALVAALGAAAAFAGGGADRAAGQAEGDALLVRRGEGAASELYRVPLGGGAATRLTRNRASDYFAVASPDGRRIAFVSDRGGDDDIWVMRADGSRPRVLTRDRPRAGGPAPLDTAPAWSPDGRRIAFASDRAGGEHEIYVMSADGSGVRRLTRTARHVIDTTPAWSPDGRRIAFASTRAGHFNLELFTMRPDGTGLRRLTRTGGSDAVLGDDATPSYAPDGSRIAFASNRDQNNEVYVMDADGSGQRRLTRSARADDLLPRFSPDGARIAFSSSGPTGASRVIVMGADGSAPRALGPGAEPSWLPGAS
jgi:TolB protein